MSLHLIWLIVYVLVYVVVFVRVLSVREKEPASRLAWIVILVFLPLAGVIAYLLLGEPWVGRRMRGKARRIAAEFTDRGRVESAAALDAIPDRYRAAFRTCEARAGWPAAHHNHASLAADSNAAIDAMVADFESARETIHVSFYIWLADGNGLKIAAALERAARRGVTCRVIADGIGSRKFISSRHWRRMRKAGVRLCVSMRMAFGLGFLLGNRVDLRNHRKIVVVDNRITYCGSQNCADPEFRVKARYAPWVDIMLRFEGPVALQNQRLFAGDWLVEADEDLSALTDQAPPPASSSGFGAVAFGTGPMSATGAMSDVFAHLLYCAEREVVISNPYFVPDPALLAALLGCARRGVATTLILPARNDSRIVAAISKAYYAELVAAGVKLREFRGGLLHAKTLVVDGALSLIGSANMDRRSLDLNFENNILLHSTEVSRAIRERQNAWLADSDVIEPHKVLARPLPRRIGDNLAAIFGPIM